MKKLLLILCAAFIFTACNSSEFSRNPAGLLTQIPPAYEIYDEYEDYYEELLLLEQISIPAQTITDNTLRLSMRHPLTLNPLLNEDVTVARILRLIFEPLIVLDEHFQPVSHLTDLEFASDFSSVILTIRNDAFWSDGTPVTADDIIFSVETLRGASANAIYKQNIENISEITRINSRVVQIRFYQISPSAGAALGFPIIPQHHLIDSFNPIGNAPFMLESHNPMRTIRLIPNPYSFRRRPQIQEIEVIFLPDTQTELYAFDQGRIDAIHMPLTDWARHQSVRHIRHEVFPAMYFEFIGFNFEREVFNDLQIRQGIAHAFNACEAINAVYLDHAVRTTSPIHPYSLAGGNGTWLPYDPTRGRILLGSVNLSEPLTIIANEDNLQRVSIAERLANSLNEVGLSAYAKIVAFEKYLELLENGEFDLFIGGVNLSLIPDIQFFFQGGFYLEDYALETAFTATRFALTESAYLQAVAQFEGMFASQLPVISLAFRHSAVLTNLRVMQNEVPAPDNVLGWVNSWEK